MTKKLKNPPKSAPRNRALPKNTPGPDASGASASRESGGKPIRRGDMDAEPRAAALQAETAPSAAQSTAAPSTTERPFGGEVPAKSPAPAPDPVAESIEPKALGVLLEIERAEKKVEDAERAWHTSREQTKELHKAFDTAVAQMRAVIKRRNQPLLPFDAATGEVKPAEPEAWRRVPVEDLGIKPRTAKALRDGGLETIGAIADFHADDQSLNRIPGLGQGAVDEVADAMERFWRDHPEHTRPSTEPAPSPSKDDEEDSSDDDE